MSVLYAKQEKRKVVELLRLLCHQLLYPRLSGDQQQAVEMHLNGMLASPRQLALQFDFSHDPLTGITSIKIDSKFISEVFNAKPQ